MLLSLLQSPVADPESEALARKVSCKPSLRRPREVGAVSWAWSVVGTEGRLAEGEGGTWSIQCQPSQAAHLETPFPK